MLPGDSRFKRAFDAELHLRDWRRCCTLCMRTRVACAEQAGIELVAVLHDAAVASHAVRDVVASVRTSRPSRVAPEVAVNAMRRGARPRVQRIGGDVTSRQPRSALSYTGDIRRRAVRS